MRSEHHTRNPHPTATPGAAHYSGTVPQSAIRTRQMVLAPNGTHWSRARNSDTAPNPRIRTRKMVLSFNRHPLEQGAQLGGGLLSRESATISWFCP